MSLVNGVAFYGKTPFAGDFVSRNLNQKQIKIIDGWLAGGLSAMMKSNECWVDDYLTAPVWSFVIPKGLWSANVLYGSLMPSVDRVGRYFPFLVVIEPTLKTVSMIEQLDVLAISLPQLLERNFCVDDILPFISLALSRSSAPPTGLEPPEARISLSLADQDFKSYWWANTLSEKHRLSFCFEGIPDDKLFIRLFSC